MVNSSCIVFSVVTLYFWSPDRKGVNNTGWSVCLPLWREEISESFTFIMNKSLNPQQSYLSFGSGDFSYTGSEMREENIGI